MGRWVGGWVEERGDNQRVGGWVGRWVGGTYLGVHNEAGLPKNDVVDHHPATGDGPHAVKAREFAGGGRWVGGWVGGWFE